MAKVNNSVQRREVNIGAGMDTSAIATAVQQITGSLVGLTNEIALLSRKTKDMAEPMQQSFKKVADTSGLAGASIMGMTGIIQDSNYGIRGMANNVQFVVPLLGQLVTQTGSLSGAFKSLWSSLMGPLGVMMAFSTGIAILERFSMRKKEAQEETKKSIESFAKESVEAKILFGQLENLVKTNGDYGKIKTLTEEVNNKYNLSLNAEKLTIQDLNKAYTVAIDNLKTKIALQAAEEKAVKYATQQLTIEEKITDLQTKKAEAENKIRLLPKVSAANAEFGTDRELAFQQDIKEATNEINKLKAESLDLTNKQNSLLGKSVELANKLVVVSKGKGGEGDAVNKAANTKDLEALASKAKTLDDAKNIIAPKAIALGEAIPLGFSTGIDHTIDEVPKAIERLIKPIENEFYKIKETLNKGIEMFIETSVIGLFDALGQELGGNKKAIDNFAKEIVGSFASFLQQMGGMIIAYGFAMDAFKNAFKTPLIAIAAGAALIAIGGAIKAAHNKKMGVAGSAGASSGGSGSYAGGYSDNDMYIYSRLDGRDLVLSNQRSQYQVRR